MKRTITALALAGALLVTAGPAVGQDESQPDLQVYFANVDTIYSFDPACLGGLACLEEVLFEPGAELRGLNYGPDENLYWCDSAGGRVGRWRWDENESEVLVRINEVFFDYNLTSSGPEQPECGWFNHRGGFAVTDGADGGVWLFEDLADYGRAYEDYAGSPVQILDTGAAGLAGVTQYIDGDLLVVVPGGKKKGKGGGTKGSVLSSDFDPCPFQSPSPCFSDPPTELISDLSQPQGVAVADGYLFVTEDKQLLRFDSEGDLKPDCADFGRDKPLLLAATVDGRLFVGTEGKRDGKIYLVDFDGTACAEPVLLQTLPKNLGYAPAVTGVAVTQTHDTVTKTVAATPDGTYEAAFGFNGSNIWELTAGAGCTASISGFLTPPARVQDAIDAIVVNDPNDPNANTVLGASVNFFGDNGNAYVWRLDLATCPAGEGDFYRHLVIGYAPFLFNGRIGVCDPTALPLPDPPFCELVELTISMSFDPALAKIDPVGGRRGAGSDYYLLDVSTGNAEVKGSFCGFESPLVEDGPTAQFFIGDTVPIKFRLALAEDEFGDPIIPNCQNGPFITQEAIALLSVARLNPLEVKKRIFANGAGENEPAYFQGPQNPSQSFHYNLDTFPSSQPFGYEPGLYLLEVAFPYDTETVKQVVIELVEP